MWHDVDGTTTVRDATGVKPHHMLPLVILLKNLIKNWHSAYNYTMTSQSFIMNETFFIIAENMCLRGLKLETFCVIILASLSVELFVNLCV